MRFMVLVLLFLILTFNSAFAEDKLIGYLAKIDGNVEVIRDGKPLVIKKRMKLFASDIVNAGSESKARIVLKDGHILALAQKSKIVLNHKVLNKGELKKRPLINVVTGKIKSKIIKEFIKPGNFKMKINTLSCTTGIRGTDLELGYSPANSSCSVATLDGKVETSSSEKEAIIKEVVSGEYTKVLKDDPPMDPVEIDPQQLRSMRDSDVNSIPVKDLSPMIPLELSNSMFETPMLGVYSPQGYMPEPPRGTVIDLKTASFKVHQKLRAKVDIQESDFIPVVPSNKEKVSVDLGKKNDEAFSRKIENNTKKQEAVLNKIKTLKSPQEVEKEKKVLLALKADEKEILAERGKSFSQKKFDKQIIEIENELKRVENKKDPESIIQQELLRSQKESALVEKEIESEMIESQTLQAKKLKALSRGDEAELKKVNEDLELAQEKIEKLEEKRSESEKGIIKAKIKKTVLKVGDFVGPQKEEKDVPVILKNHESGKFVQTEINIKKSVDADKKHFDVKTSDEGRWEDVIAKVEDPTRQIFNPAMMKKPPVIKCLPGAPGCKKVPKKMAPRALKVKNICEIDPSDKSCLKQVYDEKYCKKNPNDQLCKATEMLGEFCSSNPDSPVCMLEEEYCMLNPSSPLCNTDTCSCQGQCSCWCAPDPSYCVTNYGNVNISINLSIGSL